LCYSAKVVVHLISHEELSSIIKAAIVAYPSFLVKEEAKQIKRLILFLCVQNDQLFAPHLSKEFKNELTTNGLGQFIEYAGTCHGFTVTPGGSQQVNYHQQRDKAVQDAITFLNRNR
jgi:dienelactone hydrolase